MLPELESNPKISSLTWVRLLRSGISSLPFTKPFTAVYSVLFLTSDNVWFSKKAQEENKKVVKIKVRIFFIVIKIEFVAWDPSLRSG